MADIFKDRYNFWISLRLCDLEDCTLKLRFPQIPAEFTISGLQYSALKSAIMDQSVTFQKRVYKNKSHCLFQISFQLPWSRIQAGLWFMQSKGNLENKTKGFYSIFYQTLILLSGTYANI